MQRRTLLNHQKAKVCVGDDLLDQMFRFVRRCGAQLIFALNIEAEQIESQRGRMLAALMASCARVESEFHAKRLRRIRAGNSGARGGASSAVQKWSLPETAARDCSLLFALELGNEEEKNMKAQTAGGLFAKLAKSRDRFAPGALIAGPDPHSFHYGGQEMGSKLQWMNTFLAEIRASEKRHDDDDDDDDDDGEAVEAAGINNNILDALTYHEYLNVEGRTAMDASFNSQVDTIAQTMQMVIAAHDEARGSLTAHSRRTKTELWGGEIGPHNGGGAVSGVWAAAFLYTNTLGSLALRGHTVLLTQELTDRSDAHYSYAAIDERAKIDARSGEAFDVIDLRPTFWVAMFWRRLMGRTVLSVNIKTPNSRRGSPEGESFGEDGIVAQQHCADAEAEKAHSRVESGSFCLRVYAHCSQLVAENVGETSISFAVVSLSRSHAIDLDLSSVVGADHSASAKAKSVDVWELSGGVNGLRSDMVFLNDNGVALRSLDAVRFSTDPYALARSAKSAESDVVGIRPGRIVFIRATYASSDDSSLAAACGMN